MDPHFISYPNLYPERPKSWNHLFFSYLLWQMFPPNPQRSWFNFTLPSPDHLPPLCIGLSQSPELLQQVDSEAGGGNRKKSTSMEGLFSLETRFLALDESVKGEWIWRFTGRILLPAPNICEQSRLGCSSVCDPWSEELYYHGWAKL